MSLQHSQLCHPGPLTIHDLSSGTAAEIGTRIAVVRNPRGVMYVVEGPLDGSVAGGAASTVSSLSQLSRGPDRTPQDLPNLEIRAEGMEFSSSSQASTWERLTGKTGQLPYCPRSSKSDTTPWFGFWL